MGASRAAVRLGPASDDTTNSLCGGPRGIARSIAVRKPLICRTFDNRPHAVRSRNRRAHVPLQAPLAGRRRLGEATYAVMIRPGEEILFGNGRRLRVLNVVAFDEEEDSAFVGLLQVEAVTIVAPTPILPKSIEGDTMERRMVYV